jgi:hypothetical protein
MASTFWEAIDSLMGTKDTLSSVDEDSLKRDLRKLRVKPKEVHVHDDLEKVKNNKNNKDNKEKTTQKFSSTNKNINSDKNTNQHQERDITGKAIIDESKHREQNYNPVRTEL